MAPARWEVSAITDLEAAAARLSGAIPLLLVDLNGITSIETFLSRAWLKIGADLITRAKLHHLSGDREAALVDLRRASEYFSDRRGMSLDELIARTGMIGLARGSGDAG